MPRLRKNPNANMGYDLVRTEWGKWMGDCMGNNIGSRKLTPKQEKFAQAIIDGYCQSEACKLAYEIISSVVPVPVSHLKHQIREL